MNFAIGPQARSGLIGLGLMGRPIGMTLLRAGFPLTVWNRTPARAHELVAAGAYLAASPSELAAIAAVRDFDIPTETWFSWTQTYQRDEWLEQLLSRSDHTAL